MTPVSDAFGRNRVCPGDLGALPLVVMFTSSEAVWGYERAIVIVASSGISWSSPWVQSRSLIWRAE